MRRNEAQKGERTSPQGAESEIDIFLFIFIVIKGLSYVIRLSDNTYQIIINATILAFMGAIVKLTIHHY